MKEKCCGHCDCHEIEPDAELEREALETPLNVEIPEPNFGYYLFCGVMVLGILVAIVYGFYKFFTKFW